MDDFENKLVPVAEVQFQNLPGVKRLTADEVSRMLPASFYACDEVVEVGPPHGLFYGRRSKKSVYLISLPRQEEAVLTDFSKNGIIHAGSYTDANVSGRKFERPGLKALMARIESDPLIKFVGVESGCRLARTETIGHQIFDFFRKHGVELRIVNLGQVGDLMFSFNNMMAAERIRQIVSLCADGRKRQAKAGFHVTCVTFGTRKTIVAGVREKHPVTAPFILKMYMRALGGESLDSISRWLDEVCPTPLQVAMADRGEKLPDEAPKWHATSVRSILLNPANMGLFTYHRTFRHPVTRKVVVRPREDWICFYDEKLAIVSSVVYKAVHELLTGNVPHKLPYSPRTSMLRGILKCAGCGRPLHATNPLASGERIVLCKSAKRGRADCPGVGLQYLTQIEDSFLDEVCRTLFDDGTFAAFETSLRQKSRDKAKSLGVRRKAIEAELEKVAGLLSKGFLMTVEDSGLTPEIIKEENAKLVRRQFDLRARLASIGDPVELEGQVQNLFDLRTGMADWRANREFAGDEGRSAEVAGIIRRLFDGIFIAPAPDGKAGDDYHMLIRSVGYRSGEAAALAGSGLSGEISVPYRRSDYKRALLERRVVGWERDGAAALESFPPDVWSAVEPVFADFKTDANTLPNGAKGLFVGVLFIIRNDLTFSKIPACFGRRLIFRKHVKRMVYLGLFDAAVDIVRERDAGILSNLHLGRVGPPEFPRREVPASGWAFDYSAAEIRALAASEGRRWVRMRLLRAASAAALIKRSANPGAIAKCNPYGLMWLDELRAKGIGGVGHWVRHHQHRYDRFTPDELVRIREYLDRANADPGRRTRVSTREIQDFCASELGVVIGIRRLIAYLGRAGIRLDDIARARRLSLADKALAA